MSTLESKVIQIGAWKHTLEPPGVPIAPPLGGWSVTPLPNRGQLGSKCMRWHMSPNGGPVGA